MATLSCGTPVPAAWFADPSGVHQYRYWDGASWTDHVADDGQQSLDPLGAQPDSAAELRRREAELESELAELEEQLSRAANSSNDADLANILIADIEARMSGRGSAQSPLMRRTELQAELEAVRAKLADAD